MHDALPQSMKTHGSAWLDGVPTAVAAAADFVDNVDTYLGEAISAASSFMTDQLRQTASQVDPWIPFADRLSVEWDGSDFVYMFEGTPDEYRAVRDLEYGSLGSSPRSVIRKTAISMEDRAGKLIQQILEGRLGLAS